MVLNIGKITTNLIQEQGRTKVWVADKIGVNYKTFVDKLKNDRFDAKELIRLSEVIGLDLEKLKRGVINNV